MWSDTTIENQKRAVSVVRDINGTDKCILFKSVQILIDKASHLHVLTVLSGMISIFHALSVTLEKNRYKSDV